MLTYRYKAINRPLGDETRTPIIPLRIKGKKRSIKTTAILDSGADLTLIPKDIAKLLGLDLKGNRENSLGIGGDVPTIEAKAQIQLGRGSERYRFKIPVLVLDTDQSMHILLGRKGFFDKFRITFDEAKEKVMLKRNN